MLVSPIASVLLHLFVQLPNSTQAVSMHINCHFTVAEACDEEDDKASCTAMGHMDAVVAGN